MGVLTIYSIAAIIALQKKKIKDDTVIHYVNNQYEALSDIYDRQWETYSGDRLVLQCIDSILNNTLIIQGIENKLELCNRTCLEFCVDILKYEEKISNEPIKKCETYSKIIKDVINSKETLRINPTTLEIVRIENH